MTDPSPTERTLFADVVMSRNQDNDVNRKFNPEYIYDQIPNPDSSTIPWTTSHLKRGLPGGGNGAMLDGHAQWRKSDDMIIRDVRQHSRSAALLVLNLISTSRKLFQTKQSTQTMLS